MIKHLSLFVLLIVVFCITCKGQGMAELVKEDAKSEPKDEITFGPNNITRTMIQDRKGNIWIASWDGVFRYDGKTFTNITSTLRSARFPQEKVTPIRFVSVLEDSKGILWFGSTTSGAYRYDGKSFQHFTTSEGLLNDGVTWIFEDKTGNIWFGVNGGTSCYNGKSFRNYIINGDTMSEDRGGISLPDVRPPNEVTSIIEDKTGRLWFSARSNTYIYNGETFSVFTRNGTPFINVRMTIEDHKGNIWLGGAEGLWRYDGILFTNFTQKFVAYFYEDKSGNIWTAAAIRNGNALSRYDVKSLYNEAPAVTEVHKSKEMLCGILEARDGSIWFGGLNGVYRYDGHTVESK